VYAYSNAFCEGGSNGTGLYYLASAADKVFMPPTGMVSLLGFASDQVGGFRGLAITIKSYNENHETLMTQEETLGHCTQAVCCTTRVALWNFE
jgi:hypothetical protein